MRARARMQTRISYSSALAGENKIRSEENTCLVDFIGTVFYRGEHSLSCTSSIVDIFVWTQRRSIVFFFGIGSLCRFHPDGITQYDWTLVVLQTTAVGFLFCVQNTRYPLYSCELIPPSSSMQYICVL